VALAGHLGDEATARAALGDDSPAVRATALGALARLGRLRPEDVRAGLADPAPEMRRRACEVAIGQGADLAGGLTDALADPDVRVCEAAAFALGEISAVLSETAAVAGLAAVAGSHRSPLCREAAVAALGSIGDPAGLGAILAATTDKPAVRRRAVIALAAFDGPEVEDALRRALTDRDWQVRQAAEDLTGPDDPPEGPAGGKLT
jgi:HEAT repeat protein